MGQTIQLFNHGDLWRDFTYVDDVVKGLIHVMKKVPIADLDGVRHKIYNIGNSRLESLMDFVLMLETCLTEVGLLKEPAKKELLPMQPGDVYRTFAYVSEL